MEANLVGYLLNALDDDTQRDVERHLREHPEAQRHLQALRQGIAPLAADADSATPPFDLAARTIAFVNKQGDRRAAKKTTYPAVPLSPAFKRGWRRADVLMAAGLLMAVTMLSSPVVNKVRDHQHVLACQNNLHHYHQALSMYGDLNGGAYPKVEAEHPRRNFGGIYVPVLNQHGLLPADTKVSCLPAAHSIALPSQSDLDAMPPQQFQEWVDKLKGCYGYSLGYRGVDGRVNGLHRNSSSGFMPIMSDNPPPDGGLGNSLNHGGRGQNVLYIDGNVRFMPKRTVGLDADDIFLNKQDEVAAGVDRNDTVLGGGGSHP